MAITDLYSNSKNVTERSIAAQASRMPAAPMTFAPAPEPVTIQAGRETIVISFQPQVYVKTAQGTRTFSSRTEAAQYVSAIVRKANFWAGFDAYCRGLSLFDLHDPDEQRGYWAANSAQAETEERHDEFVEQEYIRRGW